MILHPFQNKNYENTRNPLLRALSIEPDGVPMRSSWQKNFSVPPPSGRLFSAWKKMGSSSNLSLKRKGYKLVSGDILLPAVIASNTQLTVSLNEQCSSTQLDAKLGIKRKKGKASTWPIRNPLERAALVVTTAWSKGHLHVLHLKPSTATCRPSYALMVAGAIYKAIKNLTLIDIDIKWVNVIVLPP